MWQGNPNLDAIETVRFPGIVPARDGGLLAPYHLLNREAKRLAKSNFDLGIVLRFDHWWGAALLAAAGVPRRWGYDTPGMAAWLTNAVPYKPGKHEVEQNGVLVEQVIATVATVATVGARHASPSADANSAGEPVPTWARHASPLHTDVTFDRNMGLPPLRPPQSEAFTGGGLAGWLAAEHKVVIHPGTAAANKLWTIGGWAEVARNLMRGGWAIAVTGSPDERRLADAIVQAIGPVPKNSVLINVAGQTANIAQLVWVLEQADMVLGVDSGPLHIADALGKLTLHLYGPSDETIWGPWGDPALHRAFRAPGTHPTMRLDVGSPELEGGPEMRAITSSMVLEQVTFLLAASR
jgi:heptosyltransferase-2/heptosyltransferase-3